MCHNCKGSSMCNVSMVLKTLVVVGGVNWGLVGLGMLLGKEESWNVVKMLLQSVPVVEAVVYLVVGLAAVAYLFGCKCKKCVGGVCADCVADGKMQPGM